MPEGERDRPVVVGQHPGQHQVGGDGDQPAPRHAHRRGAPQPTGVQRAAEHRDQAVAEQAGHEGHHRRRQQGRGVPVGGEEDPGDRAGHGDEHGHGQRGQHHDQGRHRGQQPAEPGVVARRRPLGQPGVGRGRQRDGERRPGQQEQRHPGEVDRLRAVGHPAGVGQADRHHRDQLLAEQGQHPGQRQAAHPRCGADREAQPGPQPQPQTAQRHQQAAGQRDHPERGAHPEDQLGGPGQVVDGAAAADAGEGQVRTGHHDRGQQRRQGGAGEPAVGLQHAGEHDADAVEHDLGREDHQEPGGQLGLGGVGGIGAQQRAGDRAGRQRQHGGQGDQHHERPAQQRRGGLPDLLAVTGGDPPASIGTTRLASAPPATTSNTMLGTLFAAR